MIIKKLKIITFRNIEELEINFIDKLNIIIGENGSGKTNILNSIYYLSTGSTIFSTKESELPKFPNSSFFLEGLFNKDSENIKIEIIFFTINIFKFINYFLYSFTASTKAFA